MSDVKTYAVINAETNIVENVILWDGESPWQPPAGMYVQELSGEAGIGWKYENDSFSDVRPVIEAVPEQTQE